MFFLSYFFKCSDPKIMNKTLNIKKPIQKFIKKTIKIILVQNLKNEKMNIKSNFTISNIKYLVENKTISNNEKEEQRK